MSSFDRIHYRRHDASAAQARKRLPPHGNQVAAMRGLNATSTAAAELSTSLAAAFNLADDASNSASGA
jgi:hypothetical protein